MENYNRYHERGSFHREHRNDGVMKDSKGNRNIPFVNFGSNPGYSSGYSKKKQVTSRSQSFSLKRYNTQADRNVLPEIERREKWIERKGGKSKTRRTSKTLRTTSSLPSLNNQSQKKRTQKIRSSSGLNTILQGIVDTLDPSGDTVKLFLNEWLESYMEEEEYFESTLMFCEVKLKELFRLTANLSHPCFFRTWVCSDLLLKLSKTYTDTRTHRLISKLIEVLLNAIYTGENGEFGLVPYASKLRTLEMRLKEVKEGYSLSLLRMNNIKSRWRTIYQRWHTVIRRSLNHWLVSIKYVTFKRWKIWTQHRKTRCTNRKKLFSHGYSKKHIYGNNSNLNNSPPYLTDNNKYNYDNKMSLERKSFEDSIVALRKRHDVKSHASLFFHAWRDYSLRKTLKKMKLEKAQLIEKNEQLVESATAARDIKYRVSDKRDEVEKQLEASLALEKDLSVKVVECKRALTEVISQHKQSQKIIESFFAVGQVISLGLMDSVKQLISLDMQFPESNVIEAFDSYNSLLHASDPILSIETRGEKIYIELEEDIDEGSNSSQQTREKINMDCEYNEAETKGEEKDSLEEKGETYGEDIVTVSKKTVEIIDFTSDNSIFHPLYIWFQNFVNLAMEEQKEFISSYEWAKNPKSSESDIFQRLNVFDILINKSLSRDILNIDRTYNISIIQTLINKHKERGTLSASSAVTISEEDIAKVENINVANEAKNIGLVNNNEADIVTEKNIAEEEMNENDAKTNSTLSECSEKENSVSAEDKKLVVPLRESALISQNLDIIEKHQVLLGLKRNSYDVSKCYWANNVSSKKIDIDLFNSSLFWLASHYPSASGNYDDLLLMKEELDGVTKRYLSDASKINSVDDLESFAESIKVTRNLLNFKREELKTVDKKWKQILDNTFRENLRYLCNRIRKNDVSEELNSAMIEKAIETIGEMKSETKIESKTQILSNRILNVLLHICVNVSSKEIQFGYDVELNSSRNDVNILKDFSQSKTVLEKWVSEIKRVFLCFSKLSNEIKVVTEAEVSKAKFSEFRFWCFMRRTKIPSKECSTKLLSRLFEEYSKNLKRKKKQGQNYLHFEGFLEMLLYISHYKMRTSTSSVSQRIAKLCKKYISPSNVLKEKFNRSFESMFGRHQVEVVLNRHKNYLKQIFLAYSPAALLKEKKLLNQLRKGIESQKVQADHVQASETSWSLSRFQKFIDDTKITESGKMLTKSIYQVFDSSLMVKGSNSNPYIKSTSVKSNVSIVFPEFLEAIGALSCFFSRNPYISLDLKIDEFIKYLSGCEAVETARKEYENLMISKNQANSLKDVDENEEERLYNSLNSQ